MFSYTAPIALVLSIMGEPATTSGSIRMVISVENDTFQIIESHDLHRPFRLPRGGRGTSSEDLSYVARNDAGEILLIDSIHNPRIKHVYVEDSVQHQTEVWPGPSAFSIVVPSNTSLLELGNIALSVPAPRVLRARSILDNGDSANRIDIAILGDGYTVAEQVDFEEFATNMVDGLFELAPFSDYRSLFNVSLAFIPSNESGVDSGNIDRDTVLNGGINCYGSRVACVGDFVTLELAAEHVPDFDFVVVVLNTQASGGSAGSVVVVTADEDASVVVAHELGHLISALADEYVEGAGGSPLCDAVNDCSEPNVTGRTERAAIKWKAWIEDSTPIPTPANGSFLNVVGLFEGARYLPAGIYRPQLSCLMRDLSRPCRVCTEAMIASFFRIVDPIEHAWPRGSITLAAAESFTASVALAPLSPPTIEWMIDGKMAQTSSSSSIALSGALLGSGAHELSVRVTHREDRVRSLGKDLLTSERRWSVEVGPDICGDRVISGAEACDDGINDDRYSGCKPGCLAPAPFCGDGFTSEGCDPGVSSDCSEACVPVPKPEESGCACSSAENPAVSRAPILLVLLWIWRRRTRQRPASIGQ